MRKILILFIFLISVSLHGQIRSGVIAATAGAKSSSTLLDGLKAYYKLDEASGNAIDSHGDNDGTNNGATQGATGKIGNCYDFEADEDDYVDMGNTADLSAPTGAGSISCWVKIESYVNYASVVSKINFNTDRNGYIFFIHVGYARGGGGSATANDYTADGAAVDLSSLSTWYHVVFTWDVVPGEMKVYINNGAADLTDSGLAITFVTNVNNFRLGYSVGPYGDVIDGLLDEVGIWSRALTSSEVAELYNSGNGKTYPFN